MLFFIHGEVSPDARAAMVRHEHTLHAAAELAAEGDAAESPSDDPQELLKLLHARQWHLLTTDTDLIRRIYEEKIEFPGGLIVHLIDDPAVRTAQGAAIDRLFERYKRLTPKRLYTVTASRVKIRQLPGTQE